MEGTTETIKDSEHVHRDALRLILKEATNSWKLELRRRNKQQKSDRAELRSNHLDRMIKMVIGWIVIALIVATWLVANHFIEGEWPPDAFSWMVGVGILLSLVSLAFLKDPPSSIDSWEAPSNSRIVDAQKSVARASFPELSRWEIITYPQRYDEFEIRQSYSTINTDVTIRIELLNGGTLVFQLYLEDISDGGRHESPDRVLEVLARHAGELDRRLETARGDESDQRKTDWEQIFRVQAPATDESDPAEELETV